MDLRKLTIFMLVLLAIPVVSAQSAPDHIISNSADWRDVYSTVMYGNLGGIPNNFLTSTRHSTIILYSIPAASEHVQVITGQDSPYIVGYEDILRSRGYSEAEELIFDNVNLELARLLGSTHRFIIVDDDYGYNALSAAPYAATAEYYVLFADELNIGEITSFLEERGVDDLIILGRVDREVREALSQFDPEIINAGDRFDNNVEMVKKYLNVKPTRQTILTNGEFIEAGLMSGADPVMFIGRTNVPDKIREYIQSSDIDVGILIGNELIGAATFIRRQIGISVFVKFAQGARQPGGPISQVEDLDRFPMPRFELDLSLESVTYNRATGQLELTISNNVGIASYFKSTITITLEDGNIRTLGDDAALFVDGDDLITVTYDLDLPEGMANASIFTIYGEAQDSLENTLEATGIIEFVEIRDNSAINITGLVYDSGSNEFLVKIKNTGEVSAYVDVELINLMINEESVNVGGDEIAELEPGQTIEIPVSVEMDEEDILDNPTIEVRGRYGERKLALIKIANAEFEFKEKKLDIMYYALILVIIVLFFLIFKRRKKKDEE